MTYYVIYIILPFIVGNTRNSLWYCSSFSIQKFVYFSVRQESKYCEEYLKSNSMCHMCHKWSRSSHPEVLCKRGILENFEKLKGKRLCQGLLFKKFAVLRRAEQVFSCQLCEIFKNRLFYRIPLASVSANLFWSDWNIKHLFKKVKNLETRVQFSAWVTISSGIKIMYLSNIIFYKTFGCF